jgi:predicted alpha/beta-hydrolase family hydrolase
MQKWKQQLSKIGDVEAFDYPYLQQSRRRPDPLPQLIAAHRQALVEARRGRTAILIGKSMGGRIGCHVSLEEKVEAIVCLGYPLCGGGDQSKLRDKVLRALTTPILLCKARGIHFVRWIFWRVSARK